MNRAETDTSVMGIGVEVDFLRRSRTGIGNYAFHMLRSTLEIESSVVLFCFQEGRWRKLEDAFFAETVLGHAVTRSTFRAARTHMIGTAADALSKFELARVVYRRLKRLRFAAHARPRSLRLFHAYNYMPPNDPGVPVLPVIYDLSTFRYPEFHPPDRVQWLASLGDTIEKAPLVQTISEFSKRELVNFFGYPANQILVAPPAAAPLFVPLGEAESQSDLDAFRLKFGNFCLAVGTLEPRKNIRSLIEAYDRLPQNERARCPLVIVGGDGWGDLDLPPQTQRLRDEGSLRFLGNVENSRLRSLYEGARLLLMPSLYEGFGMPVVEAFACGTPVAHSADTAMDEITDGLAFKVPAKDIDGWTHVLRRAIDSCDHADEAQRAVRISRAKMFDWAASADRVIAAYRQLIPA